MAEVMALSAALAKYRLVSTRVWPGSGRYPLDAWRVGDQQVLPRVYGTTAVAGQRGSETGE
jgi:hypothetical protein